MALSGGWWSRVVARAREAGGLLRGEAWPWRGRAARYSSGRGPGPPAASELDKADAWLLRKAHETGFLSWFRNGLLATGVGVISYVQSDMGREAAYVCQLQSHVQSEGVLGTASSDRLPLKLTPSAPLLPTLQNPHIRSISLLLSGYACFSALVLIS
ncbi:transmembrane protein 160 isoform X2 [Tiliqua scincoides]|uniref:transmembrane protein 160 isoform X2 n=1 Tax=Tiliqua scincoides TaxID=71010 RepID=UPI003462C9DB